MKIHSLIKPQGELATAYCQAVDSCPADEADVVLCMGDDLTPETLNRFAGKLAVVERLDGAQIKFRHLLSDPRVKFLLKQYVYPTAGAHNLPCVDGRLFTRALTTEGWKPWRLPIDDAMMAKVRLGLNFLHYPRMKKAVNVDSATERTIDVFFAGTVDYGDGQHKSGMLVTAHRKKCADAVRSLRGLETCSSPGRQLDYNSYLATMANSKIVVSPWGWGEACYRDYEAAIAGAVVVKPWRDTGTGLYSSATPYGFEPCDPMFEDLAEVVTKILDGNTSKYLFLGEQYQWEIDDRELQQRIIKGALQ